MPTEVFMNVITWEPRVDEAVGGFVGAIDECPIEQGGATWKAYVVGVHAVAQDWWLQISSDKHPCASLLLRIPPGALIADAVATLQLWQPTLGRALTTLTVLPAHIGQCLTFARRPSPDAASPVSPA